MYATTPFKSWIETPWMIVRLENFDEISIMYIWSYRLKYMLLSTYINEYSGLNKIKQ